MATAKNSAGFSAPYESMTVFLFSLLRFVRDSNSGLMMAAHSLYALLERSDGTPSPAPSAWSSWCENSWMETLCPSSVFLPPLMTLAQDRTTDPVVQLSPRRMDSSPNSPVAM